MIDNDLQEALDKEVNFTENDFFFIKKYNIPSPAYVPPHFHKWLEIVYYYDGQGGEVEMNSQKHIYKSTEFVVVRPYTIHTFHTFSEQKIIILGLDCAAFLDLFMNSGLEKEVTEFIDMFYNIAPVCKCPDYSFIEALEKIEQYSLLTSVGVILQLHDLFRHLTTDTEMLPINYQFFKAMHYLETNYYKRITIEDVAKHAGMSIYYFSRKFNDLFQVNFANYVNKIRLDRSKYLLQNSNFTISEIVYKIGFHEVSYFNKLFKQAYDLTPSEFKKQCLSKGKPDKSLYRGPYD